MSNQLSKLTSLLLISLIFMGSPQTLHAAGMKGSSYYKVHPMFHPFPDEKKGLQSIDRFGPVGIGIELMQPAFKMRVKNVEEGSPAAATKKITKGQLIDSINGRVLEKMDPRQILGDIIAKAEAADGLVRLVLRKNKSAKPMEVVVKIPVLGAYSKTWPLNCKKSDLVVRGMAEYLKQSGANGMGLGYLFLLSTGDESDLAYVREKMQATAKSNEGKKEIGGAAWHIGFKNIALCEYYLRTGDESILHTIKLKADVLHRLMYNNAWGGRGITSYKYMAGGHMNAAGVHCVTFLQLAKECGVEVDERTLQSSLKHFYRYAGHGAVSYGDGLPEGTYTDNGRNGGLAFAMAAAASLTPEGEKSVYAKARDASAMTSFYSTSWMLHGHTGGGIGEIWRGSAMGLMHKKAPVRYREFMNHRAWFYDISRRFDGSMGIVGGGRYDNPAGWGLGLALSYTIPRQNLRIAGAPKTKHCKSYQLPKRPWGTKADEIFYSLEAAPVRGGKTQDVDGVTLAEGGSWPVNRLLSSPDVTDELFLKYTHHPDFNLRSIYSAGKVRKSGRQHLALEMLKSKDPRVRRAGIVSIDKSKLSDEMVELMFSMVNDPEESWWVVMTAMEVLGSARAELIVPHIDRLIYWLKHDDWWLSRAALTALTKAAADKRYYKKILPIVKEMIISNTSAVALSPLGLIVREIKKADAEVQSYAVEILKEAYAEFPRMIKNPYGADMPSAVPYLHGSISRNLAQLPGGLDNLFVVAKKRFPDQSLPHKNIFMSADTSQFGPVVKKALEPIVSDELIPQYIAINRSYLLAEKEHKTQKKGFYYREARLNDLVKLYNRIGVTDYDWKTFGPQITDIKWQYHTFDPAEEKIWGPGTRYRKVTFPEGMENWFAHDFDAAKVDWKTGYAPFGQLGGKLIGKKEGDKSVVEALGCRLDFCRCNEPMQTFWDKEVLLMRTTLKLPKFKEDHRYRLLVAGMSHVNAGDGYRLYVNGKLIKERKRGVGKREGGRAEGVEILENFWPEFQKDEVVLAATSFLPIPGGRRSPGVKRNHFSVFLQQMKIPPLNEKVILKSIESYPMTSSEWQKLQLVKEKKEGEDTETKNPKNPHEGKYHWNGKFESNKLIEGSWEQLGQIPSVDDYNPSEKIRSNKGWPLQKLVLAADGMVVGGQPNSDLYMWTSEVLMDLHLNQALKMKHKVIDGTEYLFVESGGFHEKNGADWKCPLYVMKRQ